MHIEDILSMPDKYVNLHAQSKCYKLFLDGNTPFSLHGIPHSIASHSLLSIRHLLKSSLISSQESGI